VKKMVIQSLEVTFLPWVEGDLILLKKEIEHPASVWKMIEDLCLLGGGVLGIVDIGYNRLKPGMTKQSRIVMSGILQVGGSGMMKQDNRTAISDILWIGASMRWIFKIGNNRLGWIDIIKMVRITEIEGIGGTKQ
jgi:hypothetical protein